MFYPGAEIALIIVSERFGQQRGKRVSNNCRRAVAKELLGGRIERFYQTFIADGDNAIGNTLDDGA